MTNKIIIISSVIALVFIGAAFRSVYNNAKIEHYCDSREDKKECVCILNHVLNNVSSETRKEVLDSMGHGYIDINPEVVIEAIKAVAVCK